MFFYPTIKFQDLLVSTKKLGEIQNKDMKGKFKMREAFSFYEKCQKKLYMLNANLCPLIFFKSRNTNNFVWESFSVGRTEWQIAYFPGRRHRTSARDAAPLTTAVDLYTERVGPARA
jgi:hypothetical protein